MDQVITLFFNGSSSLYLDSLAWNATQMFVWIPFLLVVAYVVFREHDFPRMLFLIGGILFCILLCDQVASTICKPLVARWRPTHNPYLQDAVDIVNGYRGGPYGFFSSHAANTVAVAAFLSPIFRRRAITLSLFCWALLNCWTRVYLGVHYVSTTIILPRRNPSPTIRAISNSFPAPLPSPFASLPSPGNSIFNPPPTLCAKSHISPSLLRAPEQRLTPTEREQHVEALLSLGTPQYPKLLIEWIHSSSIKAAENAAYLCTHLPQNALTDFAPYTEQLIKRAQSSSTPTLRRLLLSFLLRLIEHTPPITLTDRHLQLYDECLLRIATPDITCIPALSMKIAATLTQAAPELRDELTATLELLDDYSLMPAQRAAKRIVLKRMRTRKMRKRQ